MTGLSAFFAALLSLSTAQAGEMMPDPAFAQPQLTGDWWATPNIRFDYKPGALCGTVAGGTQNPWDAILGMNGLSLTKGQTYRFRAIVSGDPDGPVRALAQKGAEPWTPEGEMRGRAGGRKSELSETFTAGETHATAQAVFQLGGSDQAWRFCLHAVSLESGAAPDASGPVAGNGNAGGIRVNQAGYIPGGPKRANLVSSDKRAAEWVLRNSSGKAVASGRTDPHGKDASSGLSVHVIDFSGYVTGGDGYWLEAGGERSHPFSISNGIYSDLRRDAASYFYKVRSGIPIDGNLAGAAYARPGGHMGKSPNTGDNAVPCLDQGTSRKIYRGGWTCGYKLNVQGGWYDAGDFGKYVVNGGIATAQMLGTYERALLKSGGASPALADGLLRIPEAGNRTADILDEARWELDFMISMMVPDGQPMAGMVHHKVHGKRWAVGPMLPHRDKEQRVLHRPSTAATLNLAAAAAQGARVFRKANPHYADWLLSSALKAYQAAEANPVIYAPRTDGSHGGGDYDDDDVTDEFYWAAAELYLATGDPAFLQRLKSSPHWSGPVFIAEGFNWRSVAGLARLNLATVPSRLSGGDLKAIQKSVIQAADGYLKTQRKEAFGLMYGPKSGYGWGSNHSVLQNMAVVATAYDLTGNQRYLQAVRESMDYILGRNALGISYVTGYGAVHAHRQHSNIFAATVDSAFPPMPKGALAGGPNSQPADDYAKKKLRGCAPQACYVDDPRSFSTNEIAINWNAALVWVASFLADAR